MFPDGTGLYSIFQRLSTVKPKLEINVDLTGIEFLFRVVNPRLEYHCIILIPLGIFLSKAGLQEPYFSAVPLIIIVPYFSR